MSGYDATLSITLPAGLIDIAKSISRALDPDVGGEDSWTPSEDGLTISTSTPCTSGFAAQAEYMLAHPEALFQAVTADYAARWADLVPPTLAECEQFCAGVIVPESVTDTLIDIVLQE